VKGGVIGLINGRAETAELLKLDSAIDLVIPRGSTAMVNKIKSQTRIPVLGHAEGVCHVYVDAAASSAMAQRVVVDAKTNYPAACNACETVLFHEATLANGIATEILRALKKAGVKTLGGPSAIEHGLVSSQEAAPSLSSECVRSPLAPPRPRSRSRPRSPTHPSPRRARVAAGHAALRFARPFARPSAARRTGMAISP
jgi:hypothetical protein